MFSTTMSTPAPGDGGWYLRVFFIFIFSCVCIVSDTHALLNSSPKPQAHCYQAAAVIAAGGKFNNHVPGVWPKNLLVCILSRKVSGSMIRFTSTDCETFLGCTKNGMESKFLRKFESVLELQMPVETRKGLASFLKQTGWSLAGELVTRDLGEHGSVPLKDHFVIHGGTKPNGVAITPLDLLQMQQTLKWSGISLEGVWLPRLVMLEPLHGGVLDGAVIDEAVAAVGALPLWAKSPTVGAQVKLLRAEVAKHGVRTCSCRTYDFEKVDSLTMQEGWVAWNVTDLSRWPLLTTARDLAGLFQPSLIPAMGICCRPSLVVPGWEALPGGVRAADLLDSGAQGRVQAQKAQAASYDWMWDQDLAENMELIVGRYKLILTEKTASADAQADGGMPVDSEQKQELLQGFGAPLRMTIQEALDGFIAIDDCSGLRELLFDLVRFSESRFGVEAKVSKFTSFILSVTTNGDGIRVLTLSVRSEEVWPAYKLYRDNQDVGEGRAMPLSRGMSFLLTEDPAKAMKRAAEYPLLEEERTKIKYARYVLRTMCFRPWIQEQQEKLSKGGPVDVESLFLNTLGQMRRWRVVDPERRKEVLEFAKTLAAFMAAFGRQPAQTVFDAGTAPYLEIIETMIPKAVTLVTDEAFRTALKASPSMEDQLLYRASSWQDDWRCVTPCTVASLKELTPYEHFAVVITGNAVLGHVIEYGFSVPNAMAVEGMERGSFYKELRNAKLAEALKTELLPLALLATEYTPTWVAVRSLRPKPLTLVFFAAVPGTGKTTCAGKLVDLLGSTVATLVSSDAQKTKTSLRELLECAQIGPLTEVLVVDRCAANSVGSVREMLWNTLHEYDLSICLLVPTSFGKIRLMGNEWHLPFSEEELAVYAGSVLARTGHIGKVEGAKGFGIVMQHVVDTARYNGSIAEAARDAWGPLVASYSSGYYCPIVSVPSMVPPLLHLATLLGLGLELSRRMRKLAAKFAPKSTEMAAIEKGAKKAAGAAGAGAAGATLASDGAILRQLVRGFVKYYDNYVPEAEELLEHEEDDTKVMAIWEKWLMERVVPVAAKYQALMRRTPDDVAQQMLEAVFGPVADTVEFQREYIPVPVVPNSFAVMVDWRTCDWLARECKQKTGVFPREQLHITRVVPDFFSDLAGMHIPISKVVGEKVEHDLECTQLRVSGISAVVDMEDGTHITLISAGPNKESVVGTTAIAEFERDCYGNFVACVPL